MKKKIDVLLVFPPVSAYIPNDPWGDYLLRLGPPTGILYVAAYLREQGYSVEVLDGAVMSAVGISLKQAISEYSPRIVGLSSVTLNAKNAPRVAKYVKTVHPGVPVICGGAHPSFEYEEMLSDRSIDAVVLMEGELTALELVRYYLDGQGELEQIEGIAFKRGDQVVRTKTRPFITDLDSLPFPARDLIDIKPYAVAGVVVGSRGCPFDCIFCAAGPLSGRKVRMRSPENTVAEIDDITERYDLKQVFFADDCFTVNEDRCRRLCELLSERKIYWTCEGRVNTVSEDMLSAMAESGCLAIQFGAESGSDSVLKQIKKGITTDQIRQAVEWTVSRGMKAICSFQIGHPYDTEQTIDETFALAAELKEMAPDRQMVSTEFAVTTPLPGTELMEEHKRLGCSIKTKNWNNYTFIEPVMDTRHLSAEQISYHVNRLLTRSDEE